MDVKPGNKQTELGVIPKDWEFSTIQELLDRGAVVGHLDGNHGELYLRSHEFKAFGVPYITANDLCGRTVSFKNCKFLSEERARRFRKGVAKNGDVLFAHNATVGPTALLSTELDYVILSTTATYFRCNPEKLINSLLFYVLQSAYFVAQYRAVMAQSTRNQVPITAQRKLSVVLPPKMAEQEAIAEALSDADALVESLEVLIAKKRELKQGAMQELLRPKNGWTETTLLALVNGKKELFDDGDWIEAERITDEGVRLVQTGNIGVGQFVEKDPKKYIF
jgi:type I restriction enzyme S subunit